jgi:hypothetical protein
MMKRHFRVSLDPRRGRVTEVRRHKIPRIHAAPFKPVPATAVEKFAFRPQSGEVRLTDSSP